MIPLSTHIKATALVRAKSEREIEGKQREQTKCNKRRFSDYHFGGTVWFRARLAPLSQSHEAEWCGIDAAHTQERHRPLRGWEFYKRGRARLTMRDKSPAKSFPSPKSLRPGLAQHFHSFWKLCGRTQAMAKNWVC